MAQLAIRGHATRGKEVIELLEMLGGINEDENKGFMTSVYYFINDNYIDWCHECTPDSDFVSYTLEEFLEKFPHKVGDKVKVCGDNLGVIISMRWEIDYVVYKVKLSKNGYETSKTSKNLQPYKEETMDRKYNVEEYLKVWEETEKGLEVVVNDRFELKENNGKFYIIKKQPQYPKTYEECCKELGHPQTLLVDRILGYKGTLLSVFQQLLICRDAYWKIAGEEMGLGKPWKPDWAKADERKYCIVNTEGNIAKWVQKTTNKILAFPTEEIRDAFYENLKELIELCKELL